MRIGMMVMIMAMIVRMAVIMRMVVRVIVCHIEIGGAGVAVHRCPWQIVFLAKLLITTRGVTVAVAGTILQTSANPFNMMVVAFLRQSNLIFEAKNLFTVLAHLAVHHIQTGFNFINPVFER